MLPAYITHADCARHEMGPQHPECPERLGAINDLLLVKGLLDYMHPIDAPLATRAAGPCPFFPVCGGADGCLSRRGLPPRGPGYRNEPVHRACRLRAAGAVVHATDLVVAGEAPTAFCCVRPPGHHAERGAAMGFCFFNNMAVGIRHALTTHGIQRVALIDFDVHHGNGSEDIFPWRRARADVLHLRAGHLPFLGGKRHRNQYGQRGPAHRARAATEVPRRRDNPLDACARCLCARADLHLCRL
jgi:acetoin utilization deacetylase AcuC-like enzyme